MTDRRSISLDDSSIAAIFRGALQFNLLRVSRLVGWADAQILKRELVPEWIIDLSLAEISTKETVDGMFKQAAVGADSEIVFGSLCALIPRLAAHDFDSGSRLSKRLKEVALWSLPSGWLDRRVVRIDYLDGMIWLARDEGVAEQYWIGTVNDLEAAHAEFARSQYLDEIFDDTLKRQPAAGREISY